MGTRTMSYPAWGNVPRQYQNDCMERIAPGVYRHHRLDVVFIIEQDINEQHAATLEHIEDDLAVHDPDGKAVRNVHGDRIQRAD